MKDLGLTGDVILEQEEILKQAIKQLRKEGNPVYMLLVKPTTFIHQLNIRAALVKDGNGNYLADSKKDLKLIVNKIN